MSFTSFSRETKNQLLVPSIRQTILAFSVLLWSLYDFEMSYFVKSKLRNIGVGTPGALEHKRLAIWLLSQYQAVQSHTVIGEATADDLAGTPQIKSRHGCQPVGVSGRGSAETIRCAVLMVPSVELFAADKCFLSPLHGDDMSLVVSGLSWSSPSVLIAL